MKKILSMLLSVSILVAAAPAVNCAAAATGNQAGTIDKHGAKTYLGLTSDWGGAWNESKFTEVTDGNVTWDGDLTIKSGSVKDVTVNGSSSKVVVTNGKMSDLTVNGDNSTLSITTGVIDDIDCSGKTTVTNGTIGSIFSGADLTINGGTIKRAVECDRQITFSGKISIGGAVTAEKIVSNSSAGISIANTVTAKTSVTLNGNNLRADEIKGSGSAVLELKSFTGRLPKITDMDKITVDGSSVATASTKLVAGTLSVLQKGEFISTYPVELDELIGPGALTVNSGSLLIHSEATGAPLLLFNNIVRAGQEAFRADQTANISENDVCIYDYNLEKNYSSGYDIFKFRSVLSEGITLSTHDVTLSDKTPALIRTTVTPKFTEFATGTKMVWELHGDTKSFSISPNTTDNSCKVTFNNAAGSYRAQLVAYLVDAKGDRLTDYKSDSCILRAGTGNSADTPPANTGTGSGIALDTSAVTIGIGNTYWVLAVTDSKTPPIQLSYNSAVAIIGKPAVYNYGGKTGWVYPVTGAGKGEVTIDIGGQKMITKVSGGSIIVDTSSYTLSPGGKYSIGVRMYGLNRNNLNVHSGNSCTSVQYGGKTKEGLELYTVTANSEGTGSVIFEITGGQSVVTQINVVNGAKPGGVSGRLIASAS